MLSALPLWADLYYLDQPAPISLKHGEFMISTRLQSEGGVMARAGVGLFDRLTLGLSYSIDQFFGHDPMSFPPIEAVGFQARLLGLDEGSWNPSIMVGYESQGYDGYDSSRFATLPSGAYLLLGKTFWSTRTDVSIGANYWPPAYPSGFNGHLAIREFYFPDWDFILEYDLSLNDPLPNRPFLGLLNFAISRTVNGNLNLKLGLRDILSHHSNNGLNRVFDIGFQQHF
jgi:hypothetical protein